MNNDLNLPQVGTPEEAKKKMTEGYASFLDSAAKFVTIADFYSDETNEGKALGTTFRESYLANFAKLKAGSVDDFIYLMEQHATLYLDFINDIQDNLTAYFDILKGQDASLSDYDKACDLLAIKDEFTDLEKVLDDTNKLIAEDRYLETHYNDPLYDIQAKNLAAIQEANDDAKKPEEEASGDEDDTKTKAN
jgi:hypothetical protein